MSRPISGLAAVEAGNLLRKLDGADDAQVLAIVHELRAVVAADGSSLHELGMRLVSPPFHIMYLPPGVPGVGQVAWPKELRAEAISIVEETAWKFVRTFEENRKISGVLAALRSKKGRMTFNQAAVAEGFVRCHRQQAGKRP